MTPLKVYLITGEPSGDLLGSRLMRALKKQTEGQVEFMGVGGETMQSEGLTSLFDIKDLAVMGIFEVLPGLPKILRHMNNVIADIKEKKPDIIVTIDSYSFCARIHKKLKKAKCTIPHVHYVAPQVWAWKKGRAKTVAKFIDHMFCLLPSEPAYFTPYGMATTFVGHPVVEGGASKGNGQAFRKNHLIPQKTLLVCMLPGSRRNEIGYLLPVFKEAVEKIALRHPDLCVIIPTVKTVSKEIKTNLKEWSIPYLVVEGEADRYDAFAASNVAIAASGTVSLELAMADVPHLIAYKVNKLTGFFAKLLLKIKYVNLINILSGREIIPELLQDNCTPDKIAETVEGLLTVENKDVKHHMNVLGFGGDMTPSEVMAGHIIKMAKRGE
ncbi:MAG: lipid-A-disaccharide synthase [Alphaproteobacteria bacterium]|nr:lipid-A-disaccharide synthase [Alphaproteobacteria bacterium]